MNRDIRKMLNRKLEKVGVNLSLSDALPLVTVCLFLTAASLTACGGGGSGSAVSSYELTPPVGQSEPVQASSEPVPVLEPVTAPSLKTLSVFQNGTIGGEWNDTLRAVDSGNGWQRCINDGGAGCPNISWELIPDSERGQVIEIRHGSSGDMALFLIETNNPKDLSEYAGGVIKFDVRVVSGDSSITMKIECVWPCESEEQTVGPVGENGWETVQIPIDNLAIPGRLDLSQVDTGLVIWASGTRNSVFQLDNVFWEASPDYSSETEVSSGEVNGWTNPNYSGAFSPDSYSGYGLVWSDEFSGSELNEGDWSFEIGTRGDGWGNNELQYYRRNNTRVIDGLLVIEARREDYGDRQYTSSRLVTKGKQSFRYGRIDIRAAMPFGQGLWPAIWMMGSSFPSVGWPYCGEIDIMEMVGGSGRERTVVGTAHWNKGGAAAAYSPTNNAPYNGGPSNEYLLPGGESLATSFHVFSLIWTRESIKWEIDGFQYNEMTIDNSADLAPFRNKFFFIMNVAVGGNWPGAPDQSTRFPQQMLVDYIRVFQRQ